MIVVASIIALIFIFGIIIIIGWLTAWNLIGEFSAQTSDLVQKIYEVGGVFSELFTSIRNFVEDTKSKDRKEELLLSIDRTADMIDRLNFLDKDYSNTDDNIFEDSEYFSDSGLSIGNKQKTSGQKFKEHFANKVEIYSSDKSQERKLKKLHLINHKLGKVFGGPVIENCMNIIDENLVSFQNNPAAFRRGVEDIVWSSISTIMSSFQDRMRV